MNKNLIFFGTSRFAVIVLETLFLRNINFSTIITTPDAPAGRKQILTPSPVKVWAKNKDINLLQPEKLSDENFLSTLKSLNPTLSLVASYGKIIPENVLSIPSRKTLNIHPSILPSLRGPSPLQQSILSEEKVGVTIMELDAEMDHGPTIIQKEIETEYWPMDFEKLEEITAIRGAEMFAGILDDWIDGKIQSKPQNHEMATYTKMIEKKDGEISLNGNSDENYRKYLAFGKWPGVFFFDERNGKKIRVKILKAEISEGKFTPTIVVPEGKKDISWKNYLMGKKPTT